MEGLRKKDGGDVEVLGLDPWKNGYELHMVYANYTGAIVDLAVVGAITVVIFAAVVRLFKWRED